MKAGSNQQEAPFYRPELDGLRFFAFLLVFFHHSFVSKSLGHLALLSWGARIPAAIALGGEFGVDLFFVLSAYLITELLVREKAQTGSLDVKGFYLRRVLRIWPLYFAFVLFCFILPFFTTSVFPAKALLCFLLLAGNWYFVANNPLPSPVSPLWSVSIEEQFYLLWPWVVRKAGRKQMLWISILLIAAAVTVRCGLLLESVSRSKIWFNTLTHMDAIGAGVLLVVVLNGRVPRLSVVLRLICIGVALGLLVAATTVFDVLRAVTPAVDGMLGYGCGLLAAVLLFIAFLGAPQDGLKIVSASWLTYLGRISYGLYVLHQLVLEAVKVVLLKTLGACPPGLQFVLALGPTIVFAAVSYRWLETPFLRLKKRFQHVRSGSEPETVKSLTRQRARENQSPAISPQSAPEAL